MESEAPKIDKSPAHIRGLTVGIRICWMARRCFQTCDDSQMEKLGIFRHDWE